MLFHSIFYYFSVLRFAILTVTFASGLKLCF